MASLEALLRTRGELHRKRLQEGRRRVRQLEGEAAVKSQQNAEVMALVLACWVLGILACGGLLLVPTSWLSSTSAELHNP